MPGCITIRDTMILIRILLDDPVRFRDPLVGLIHSVLGPERAAKIQLSPRCDKIRDILILFRQLSDY